MKISFTKIYILFIGCLIATQCTILTEVPKPTPTPTPTPQPKIEFASVDYHFKSLNENEFLVDDSLAVMKPLGTKKSKGLNWTIIPLENEVGNFFRIKSGYGNQLYSEGQNLKLGRPGSPQANSPMWAFEKLDTNIFTIKNRWQPDQYLYVENGKVKLGITEKNDSNTLWQVVLASEIEVIIEEPIPNPIINNKIVPVLEGDPFKGGHPNIESKLRVQTTPVNINAIGSTGEPFLGQIKMFAGNFAPRGWAFCEGQVLSIAQHAALFSLLGTTYGGDGRTTFALPDLKGRAPVHAGKALGSKAEYKLGKRYGNAKASLAKPEYKNKETLEKIIDISESATIPQHEIEVRGTQSINYIIALGGVFPSRG